MDADVALEERAQDGLDIVEMRGSRRPRLDDLDHSEILRVEAVEKIGSSLCFAQGFAEALQEVVQFL